MLQKSPDWKGNTRLDTKKSVKASILVYLPVSVFWSLRLSLYSMCGLAMPWVIMFIHMY